MLIWLAEDAEEAKYCIHSVALAMFLMMSTLSADTRGACALLFWGRSVAQRIFGASLLLGTVLLVIASMRVLFMDAKNNAELVIGAATVLFIEDVVRKDTKTL